MEILYFKLWWAADTAEIVHFFHAITANQTIVLHDVYLFFKMIQLHKHSVDMLICLI